MHMSAEANVNFAQQAQFVLPNISRMPTGSGDPRGGFQPCSGPWWILQGLCHHFDAWCWNAWAGHKKFIFQAFKILFCFLEMDTSPIQAAACPVLAGLIVPAVIKVSLWSRREFLWRLLIFLSFLLSFYICFSPHPLLPWDKDFTYLFRNLACKKVRGEINLAFSEIRGFSLKSLVLF